MLLSERRTGHRKESVAWRLIKECKEKKCKERKEGNWKHKLLSFFNEHS